MKRNENETSHQVEEWLTNEAQRVPQRHSEWSQCCHGRISDHLNASLGPSQAIARDSRSDPPTQSYLNLRQQNVFAAFDIARHN